jgi:type II secretory pathway component PulC
VASPPPAPKRALPPNYTLGGTILSGDTRNALLRQTNGNKTLVVREGQVLEGWTLRKIKEGHVVFEADGAVFELAFPPLSQTGQIKKNMP